MMETISSVKNPVMSYSMRLSVHSSVKARPLRVLDTVVVCAKRDPRSGGGFSWRKKRPRKKYSPHPHEKGDISILYSKNAVVKSTFDLVKACNEHINDYVEDCDLSAAEKVFSLMTEKRVEPDSFTYTILMKGYSRVGNTQKVSELFAEMETKGIMPSIVTFNTVIRSYANNGDLQGAQLLLKKMKNSYGLEPDGHTYGSMLNVCVTARDLKTARSLFHEMDSLGIKQNNISVTTMIDVYAECCNEENGQQYLEECRELVEDVKEKGILADKRTCNTLIKLCTRGNLTADAMKMLHEMRRKRMHPNVVSYNTVFDGISKDQNLSNKEVLELSTKILKMMKKEEIRPNATTYNSLISVALRVEDLYRAEQLFKEMKTLKVEPTVVTYGTMIKCREKLGDPKDGEAYLKPCLDLLKKCEKAGIKLDATGYTSLLSACANAFDLDRALNIWDKIIADKVKLDVVIYSAMIEACLSKQREDMAFNFFNEMKTFGIKANVVTWGTFLSYFVKKNDRTGAEKICDEMKMHGVEPNKVISKMLQALGIE